MKLLNAVHGLFFWTINSNSPENLMKRYPTNFVIFEAEGNQVSKAPYRITG